MPDVRSTNVLRVQTASIATVPQHSVYSVCSRVVTFTSAYYTCIPLSVCVCDLWPVPLVFKSRFPVLQMYLSSCRSRKRTRPIALLERQLAYRIAPGRSLVTDYTSSSTSYPPPLFAYVSLSYSHQTLHRYPLLFGRCCNASTMPNLLSLAFDFTSHLLPQATSNIDRKPIDTPALSTIASSKT
jgi:hypothetical protein